MRSVCSLRRRSEVVSTLSSPSRRSSSGRVSAVKRLMSLPTALRVLPALALVPALLPAFFLITYSAWLWFFGHNLHPWGAFTVKPFMPTVFGEGKVAQFSTYSYPYWGYALLLAIFVCMMLALLIRRKQLRENPQAD